MTFHHIVRAAVLIALLGACVTASSCDSSSGIGMSPTAGPRWGGGGMSGPPIFPGGPR